MFFFWLFAFHDPRLIELIDFSRGLFIYCDFSFSRTFLSFSLRLASSHILIGIGKIILLGCFSSCFQVLLLTILFSALIVPSTLLCTRGFTWTKNGSGNRLAELYGKEIQLSLKVSIFKLFYTRSRVLVFSCEGF